MDNTERILGLIHDSKWHDMSEIQKEISMSEEKLNKLICFLQEYNFICKEDRELKITPRGLEFLELPN